MDTATKTTETVDTTTTALPATRPQPQTLPAMPAKEPRPRRSRGDDIRTVSEIASAIARITAEVGIVSKEGVNRFHGYKYAKMEDVLQRVTPLLAKYGIVVMQTETERSMFDDNRVLAVQYEFTIAHSSGEVWPDRPRQTGVCRCRDSKGGWDDKAFNKCHTAARKYFLLALFQIATGDQPDADEDRDLAPPSSPPNRRARAPAANVMREPAPQVALAPGEVMDPETGEITQPAHAPVPRDGGATGTAPVAAAPGAHPAGAATTSDGEASEAELIAAEWQRCDKAAFDGMVKLKAVWDQVPAKYRTHLEHAKENIWKPRAREHDKEF